MPSRDSGHGGGGVDGDGGEAKKDSSNRDALSNGTPLTLSCLKLLSIV